MWTPNLASTGGAFVTIGSSPSRPPVDAWVVCGRVVVGLELKNAGLGLGGAQGRVSLGLAQQADERECAPTDCVGTKRAAAPREPVTSAATASAAWGAGEVRRVPLAAGGVEAAAIGAKPESKDGSSRCSNQFGTADRYRASQEARCRPKESRTVARATGWAGYRWAPRVAVRI